MRGIAAGAGAGSKSGTGGPLGRVIGRCAWGARAHLLVCAAAADLCFIEAPDNESKGRKALDNPSWGGECFCKQTVIFAPAPSRTLRWHKFNNKRVMRWQFSYSLYAYQESLCIPQRYRALRQAMDRVCGMGVPKGVSVGPLYFTPN